MDLQPVRAAPVGENHDVGVRRRDEEVADEVLLARAHPDAPFAAAALAAIRRDRGALDVAGVAHRDRHVFLGDQILDVQLARLAFDDLRAPLVAVALADVLQLVDDDLHQQALARENRAQPLDRLQQLGELVENLLPLEAGEALELHVENRLGLHLRQAELRHQPFACFRRRLRRADQRDHRVEVIERDLQPFEKVIARFRLAELELGAAAHDVAAEFDEAFDQLEQRHHLRPATDDGEHDDAEAQLQLGVLIEVVEDHLRHFAAFELDDDPHAVAIGLVAKIGNSLDDFVFDELGDALDQLRLVHLVGNLGDDAIRALSSALEGLPRVRRCSRRSESPDRASA